MSNLLEKDPDGKKYYGAIYLDTDESISMIHRVKFLCARLKNFETKDAIQLYKSLPSWTFGATYGFKQDITRLNFMMSKADIALWEEHGFAIHWEEDLDMYDHPLSGNKTRTDEILNSLSEEDRAVVENAIRLSESTPNVGEYFRIKFSVVAYA